MVCRAYAAICAHIHFDSSCRLLETFITVFTCMYLYDLTITHFGDAGAFLEEPWTIAISFALGGIASALVQVSVFKTYWISSY